MRQLTITREAMGFRGGFYNLKIYVSDPNGKVVIKGVPCTFFAR